MGERKVENEVLQHRPRHREVQRFVELLFWDTVVRLLFGASILFGPAIIAGIAVVLIVFGLPSEGVEGDWWDWGITILATALVVPLYYLRRYVEHRVDEARYQLEQIGLPESPEDTDTSHTT